MGGATTVSDVVGRAMWAPFEDRSVAGAVSLRRVLTGSPECWDRVQWLGYILVCSSVWIYFVEGFKRRGTSEDVGSY